MSDEYEEVVEVPFSDLVAGVAAAEGQYFLKAVVKLRNGKQFDVPGEALKYRPEGVQIITSWRKSGEQKEGKHSEIPTQWVLHPWHMVEMIEYVESWISGEGSPQGGNR